MDQDKEFLQWIMQDNPLDDVDAAYHHPQPPPPPPQQQQPTAAIHRSSHPSHQQKPTNYPHEQHLYSQNLYEERHSQQQRSHSNGNNIITQSQQIGPVPPSQSYAADGTTASSQQQHHHYQQQHHQTYYSHQHQQQLHEAKPTPEGRLSDEDEEHYTDAQLKMMTSKERRQLRNKISARNFRNRRKEYIASLEGEVAKFKNENSQLRLEIKWVRTTMNKLQKENDHLRVKLALCHGGIKSGEEGVSPADQPPQELQQQQTSSSPPSANVPMSSVSPPPQSVQPSLQHAQQSHHVLPTTTNANVSQKHSPSSSLNLQTQNGNSSHITPALDGSNNYLQQHISSATGHPHQQQHHHTSSPPHTGMRHQPPSPPSSQSSVMNQHHQQPQKPMQGQNVPPPNSGMSAASVFTTSPPQAMPGTIDTIHSDSSSSFTSHLSPPNFADLSDAWDLVIPNEFSSYCPPQSSMTQQPAPLFVPNMPYATPDYHQQPANQPHQQALVSANVPIVQQQQRPQQYQVTHNSQLQQQPELHGYPANQATLYRPPASQQLRSTNTNNNSYVSSAVVPDFNLENVLCKPNQVGGMDNNLFKAYPLLVPALMSIVIGHTMSMSTADLLSHTRLLSTPQHPSKRLAPTAMLHPFDGDHQQCLYFGKSKMMMMTPGLRSQHNHSSSPGVYPLSKKQVHAMWENLLDQMVKTKSKQRYRQQQKLATTSTTSPSTSSDSVTSKDNSTKASQAEEQRDIESEIAQEMMMTTMKWNSEHNNMTPFSNSDNEYDDDYDYDYDDDEAEEPWYDMPVTGFKAICPLYWMQRQFCRFVITYVVVKYPHLEDPCKTYLPICEQFRRKAITN